MRDPPAELPSNATRFQRGWWTVRMAWWHLHHSWANKLTFTPWWGTLALVAASALGAVRCWLELPGGTHWAVFGALVVGAAPAVVREGISLDGDSGNWGPAAWGVGRSLTRDVDRTKSLS